MIKNIVYRYLKLVVVCLMLYCSPTMVNTIEIENEWQYYNISKMYPWLTRSFYFKVYHMFKNSK